MLFCVFAVLNGKVRAAVQAGQAHGAALFHPNRTLIPKLDCADGTVFCAQTAADAAVPHRKALRLPHQIVLKAVAELCEAAQYPRATFYNYFDDKYDLLNYCWQTLADRVGLYEYRHGEENEMLYLYFDRIYDFTKQSESMIRSVLSHNGDGGYMFSSFRNFLNGKMRMIFRDCPQAAQKDIPNELLADHYSNTLFLVWQWIAVKSPSCSKTQAHEYLKLLIG